MVIISSTFFPYLYNTTAEVQELAAYMMIVSAATMPFCAFANSAYYTLRSGGKVIITILFDSCYMWAIVMPTCIIMAYFTNISIHWFFAIGQALEIFKLLFGILLLKRGTWLKNLVDEENINKENEGAYV
jgi:Na+-driven multidrug efflux pump